MCRLLGIYGQTDIWRDIALAFSKQAESGAIPPGEDQKPGHKDGWGITMTNQNHTAMIPVIRQLGSARKDSCFRLAIQHVPEPPGILLCHLRKASDIIPITLANTHPFIHNGWAIIHNGTVFKAEALPRDPGFMTTSDGSDTEHLFHYLLTWIKNMSSTDIAPTIAKAVASVETDYSALNCILSNGRDLFAIRHYRKWENYYTLYTYRLPGSSVIISSQPVELPQLKPDNWQPIPNNILLKIHGSPPKIEQLPIAASS